VSERNYAVVSLDELDTFPAMTGAPVLMPLRLRHDVRAFGINCWTAPVGAPVIERHSEPDGDEEVYIVVRGRVRFTIGEETFESGPATVVYVPPDTTREAVAIEPETLVIAIGSLGRSRSARSACGSSLRTARISRRCDQTHAGNSYWMSEAAYRGLG
jgi:quercetin dioxygenase-like cupin family protein